MQRSLLTSFRKIPLNKGPITSFLWRVNSNRSLGLRWMSSSRHKNPFADKENTGSEYREHLKTTLSSVKVKHDAQTTSGPREKPAPPPPRPLFFSGTIGKYSHELFDTASKANNLDTVQHDLNNFFAKFNQDQKIQTALTSPIISKSDKITILKDAAGDMSPSLFSVLERMVVENRIRDLKILVDYFSRLVAEKLGHVSATVFSVDPLTKSQIKRIEQKLSSILPQGKTLVLDSKLNPKLIGGLKIRLGDRELDLSVASKIKQFEQIFRAAMT